MNTNEAKVIRLMGSGRCVSLNDILDNLRVLRKQNEGDKLSVRYILTRNDKNLPWPAPYQVSDRIDGRQYHCCSYVTLDSDYEEDVKELKVYIV